MFLVKLILRGILIFWFYKEKSNLVRFKNVQRKNYRKKIVIQHSYKSDIPKQNNLVLTKTAIRSGVVLILAMPITI